MKPKPVVIALAFCLLVVTLFGVTDVARKASAQDVINNRIPTLEERLNFGLKTRRPTEKAFIRKVVALVDNGTLKQKVVDESFFWVRREMEKSKMGDPNAKKHILKYPFIFFQRVVKLNAKRVGVSIQ